MSELQPAQNNLSAIFLAACGALPAPTAILGSAVPMTGAQRVVSRKLTKSIAAGVAAIAIAGASYGIVSATSSGSSAAAGSSGTAGGPGSGGGSNARSGPAAGGSSGTASGVSTSGFTLTTAAGQKVTVDEASATTYEKGTGAASASAVTT